MILSTIIVYCKSDIVTELFIPTFLYCLAKTSKIQGLGTVSKTFQECSLLAGHAHSGTKPILLILSLYVQFGY